MVELPLRARLERAAGEHSASGTVPQRPLRQEPLRREKCTTDTYVDGMSRAFVNEDHFVEDVPDRPVSEYPNYVTQHGLELIDAALNDARRRHGEAQATGDREALASAGRDVRYWGARRASAQVVSSEPDIPAVQFGSTVSLVRDDGRKQTFTIVGEDEADPAKGTISHVSPLARTLLRGVVGDVVRAGNDEAEITAIE
jgi:transcription elongation GreA/GreB family factor